MTRPGPGIHTIASLEELSAHAIRAAAGGIHSGDSDPGREQAADLPHKRQEVRIWVEHFVCPDHQASNGFTVLSP